MTKKMKKEVEKRLSRKNSTDQTQIRKLMDLPKIALAELVYEYECVFIDAISLKTTVS